ncbi:MAG: hypothetical protein V4440_03080, partial [Pseudomonadota bacterium]
VIKHKITDLFALDPISVIMEDIEPGKGKITIECYGESWTSYWGSMGEGKTIAKFFCSCDEHYLAGKLSSIDSHITDWDNMPELLRAKLIKMRRAGDIEKHEAREAYEDCSSIDSEVAAHFNHDTMEKIIGEEWYRDMPQTENPKYNYLCRIIKAVQGAIQRIEADKAAA